jgi:regulatory protein
MTAERLEKAAYHYLERFASSSGNLKRVLEGKIRRRNDDFAPLSTEQAGWIDDLVEKCIRLELIDDEAYARARVNGLRRQGKSSRAIRQWLKSRFIPDDLIEQAMQEADAAGSFLMADTDDDLHPDAEAALTHARKKRLGPWGRSGKEKPDREPEDRKAALNRRNREVASFARAGFSFDLAQKIIDSPDQETARSRLLGEPSFHEDLE